MPELMSCAGFIYSLRVVEALRLPVSNIG